MIRFVHIRYNELDEFFAPTGRLWLGSHTVVVPPQVAGMREQSADNLTLHTGRSHYSLPRHGGQPVAGEMYHSRYS